MAEAESTTIGAGGAAITFTVEYFGMDAHRAQWAYSIMAADGAVLSMGTDLSTPEYGDAIGALQSLIVFSAAAVESHRSPYSRGVEDHGFATLAVEAFDAISDDLELAILGFDEADQGLAD